MENRKPQKRSRSYKEEPKENFRIEKYNNGCVQQQNKRNKGKHQLTKRLKKKKKKLPKSKEQVKKQT